MFNSAVASSLGAPQVDMLESSLMPLSTWHSDQLPREPRCAGGLGIDGHQLAARGTHCPFGMCIYKPDIDSFSRLVLIVPG